METINVIKNDVGYDLEFTLKDNDGNAVDLTTISSLLLKTQKINETALKFSGNMTVDVASSGTCHYTVVSGDFDEVGEYFGEIQATFASGKIITFTGFMICVQAELPK